MAGISLLLVGTITASALLVPKFAGNQAKPPVEGTDLNSDSTVDPSANQNSNGNQQSSGGNNNAGSTTNQNGNQQNSGGNNSSNMNDSEESQENSENDSGENNIYIDENASKGLAFASIGAGTCKVTGVGSCQDADIIIPAMSPSGERVVAIREHAFTSSRITSVTIPDGVTTIESRAFEHNSGLISVIIPDSVTSIGSSAFTSCGSLVSVTIPKSLTSIESSTFSGCQSLTSISIPENVTTIGNSAFSNCSKLQTLTISNGVLNIGASAFSGCSSLTSVSIPSSVVMIGEKAFNNCANIFSFTVDSANTRYDGTGNCLIDKTTKTLITGFKSSIIPNDGRVTQIGANAFNGLSGLQSIFIPDGVVGIGDYAFLNCNYTGTLTIPASVQYIGQEAFRKNHFTMIDVDPQNKIYRSSGNCLIDIASKRLILGADIKNGVVIPDDGSVTLIDTYAFENTKNLTSIQIPTGILRIEDSVFTNSAQLQEVHLADSVTYIGTSAFESCKQLKTVTWSNGLTSIGNNAFKSCNNLLEANLPDKVEYIGDSAFYGCNKLSSLTLPSGIKSIEKNAFRGCSLSALNIPSSLTSIGAYAFTGAGELTSITVDSANSKYRSSGNCLIEIATKTLLLGCGNSVIPADGSVTRIGDSAFYGCDTLTSISVPNGVTHIGSSAFSCANLTSIYIPTSVATLGRNAIGFDYRSKPTIHYAGTEQQWKVLLDASEFSPTSNVTVQFESTN